MLPIEMRRLLPIEITSNSSFYWQLRRTYWQQLLEGFDNCGEVCYWMQAAIGSRLLDAGYWMQLLDAKLLDAAIGCSAIGCRVLLDAALLDAGFYWMQLYWMQGSIGCTAIGSRSIGCTAIGSRSIGCRALLDAPYKVLGAVRYWVWFVFNDTARTFLKNCAGVPHQNVSSKKKRRGDCSHVELGVFPMNEENSIQR